MSKSAIDSEINNQIFRKDYPMVIALRRDLTQLSPVRLAGDGNDFIAGQCLARNTSTGEFQRFSAVSGGSYDTPCVLFQSVLAYEFDATVTSGTLARAIMSAAGLYKSKLIDYNSAFKTAISGREITDATGLTVVKF